MAKRKNQGNNTIGGGIQRMIQILRPRSVVPLFGVTGPTMIGIAVVVRMMMMSLKRDTMTTKWIAIRIIHPLLVEMNVITIIGRKTK